MSEKIIRKVFFSPTGTSRIVADTIADEIGGRQITHDILKNKQKEDVACNSDEIVVFSFPVYAGRIPAVCPDMLSRFKGENTLAIIAVVYGNRAYEDGLIELYDIVSKQGFVVIGAGAFVGQHSIFPAVGEGRPDQSDRQIIKQFAKECATKIESENIDAVKVAGNSPYRQIGTVPLKPTGNELCNECGECVAICPVGAISPTNPRITDVSLCIPCSACIKICPQHARNYWDTNYHLAAAGFGAQNTERKEPELFV